MPSSDTPCPALPSRLVTECGGDCYQHPLRAPATPFERRRPRLAPRAVRRTPPVTFARRHVPGLSPRRGMAVGVPRHGLPRSRMPCHRARPPADARSVVSMTMARASSNTARDLPRTRIGIATSRGRVTETTAPCIAAAMRGLPMSYRDRSHARTLGPTGRRGRSSRIRTPEIKCPEGQGEPSGRGKTGFGENPDFTGSTQGGGDPGAPLRAPGN